MSDPFSKELLGRYNRRFPDGPQFSAGSGSTGMYRGLKLWEAAVTEAGSLDQAAVVAALDHAKIDEGPGGPAEMVPGQHHVRLNVYIAQVHERHARGRREPGRDRPQRAGAGSGVDTGATDGGGSRPQAASPSGRHGLRRRPARA